MKSKKRPSMSKRRRAAPAVSTHAAVTVNDYFTALAGKGWHRPEFLEWPPDVFFLTAYLLQRTGAYVRLVKQWPPQPRKQAGAPSIVPKKTVKPWCKEMRRRGRMWWEHANAALEAGMRRTDATIEAKWGRVLIDQRIKQSWATIAKYSNQELAELGVMDGRDRYRSFWQAVFEILAAADEACAGIGGLFPSPFLHKGYRDEGRQDYFFFHASQVLRNPGIDREHDDRQLSATLCRAVPPSLGSVLPKGHTPQSGITLRSVSHNLAFVRQSEVCITYSNLLTKAGFFEANNQLPGHSINVLFVPWPDEVRPRDFVGVECSHQSTESRFGFFTYRPKRPSLKKRTAALAKMIEAAEKLMGRVDGVLMPELALGEGEIDHIAKAIHEQTPTAFLIAGVGAASNGSFGSNKVVLSAGRFVQPSEQAKHHRWQLEQKQIDQYGLGTNLDPQRVWWEHIPIENRQMNVVPVGERITMSLLICEDLARQDPIAEVIRSIGPNLVIALLMDGPQLAGRWPAHYATVFADDPGSSVLTVTSIGMSQLSRPKGQTAKRVVGLWKDHIDNFREIELPPKATALILTLTLEDHEEWTADGRSDGNRSTYVRLNGIHPVFTEMVSPTST